MTEDETEKADITFGHAAAAFGIAEALAQEICLRFPELTPGLLRRLDVHALYLEEKVHSRDDTERAVMYALQRLQSLTNALDGIGRRSRTPPGWKRRLLSRLFRD